MDSRWLLGAIRKKLSSFDQFQRSADGLKAFAHQRRTVLLAATK